MEVRIDVGAKARAFAEYMVAEGEAELTASPTGTEHVHLAGILREAHEVRRATAHLHKHVATLNDVLVKLAGDVAEPNTVYELDRAVFDLAQARRDLERRIRAAREALES